MVKELLQLLKDLVHVHQQLNGLADEKTAALKKNDVSALQAILKKESVHLKTLRQLEMTRQRTVAALTDNIPELRGKTSVSLSELADHVPADERNDLHTLQKSLLAEVESLRAKNDLNQVLIADSLQFVTMSLDLLQPDPEAVTYRRPEEDGPDQEVYSIFDSRV